jgi:SAM-dependent methyltransferase
LSKYDPQARGWTETQYARPGPYLEHRADLIVGLGPQLQERDRVLDLACGDGGLAVPLRERGLAYLGVDAGESMVAAARERGVDAVVGDLNDYEPPEPVAATTCFRAIYYARDRRAFFRRAAGYTQRKLVFDLNPRQFRLEDVRSDLEAAGFDRLALRPFLVPQTVALPGVALAVLRTAERVRPLARALLTVRFTYVCAAYRETNA